MAELVFTSDGAPLSQPEDVIGSLGKQEQYWKASEMMAHQSG